MEPLHYFQERAISIIDTARIKDDWSKNFLQVKQLITFDRSVMTYKIMNRLRPENLWNKFQRRSHYSNYNTRFCENLQIPKYNLDYSKKRFSKKRKRDLKAWNEIPINIRELPALYQYKKQLKSHLIS